MAWDREVDVLVVGSGKGALTGALSAHVMGAGDVLVVEKAAQFGGTSALSGGVIWIPDNRYAREAGVEDSVDEARAYLKRTIPDEIRRDAMIDAYLENGPAMVDFLHANSHARYSSLTMYPDYHSHIPGAKAGRALEPEPFDSASLGDDNDLVSHSHQIWYIANRIPLTLAEQKRIQIGAKGWRRMVARLLLRYALDLPWRRKSKYDRYRKVGGSGVARLYLSIKERGVPMWRNAPMRRLIREDGRVTGAIVTHEGRDLRIRARKGVLMGAGGFEQNQAMREAHLPHPTDCSWSAGVPTNTGDAVNAGVDVGAATDLMQKAWWCMTTNVPGEPRPRLVIIEKALPGCCLVNKAGRRFLNESQNYQTLVDKLYEAHSPENPCVPCWLVFDARYRRDYIVGPLLTPGTNPDWMFPKSWYERGFLAKASSIADLARQTGIDTAGLTDTIARMNAYASTGVDLDFNRGATEYDRYYGDPKVTPNPNLAQISEAPFYAMKLAPGDIGTQGGLVTNTHGQVMGTDGAPIAGLYATGNCTAAVIPTYPGAGSTLGPAMVFAWQAAKHMTGYNG
ncbi:MAG: hypothetical protein RIS94_191 [Pseudomonadota bacterium]|jgi:3-oxosteroid 1-dehydrogenase